MQEQTTITQNTFPFCRQLYVYESSAPTKWSQNLTQHYDIVDHRSYVHNLSSCEI